MESKKEEKMSKIVRKESEVLPSRMGELIKFSELLYKSGMFPNVNSAMGALAIIEYGRELGIPPVIALNSISVIKGRLCASAQLMLGLAVRNGVTYKVETSTDKVCRIKFVNGNLEYVSEYTIEEAEKAGLVRPGSSWTNYPKDMLWSRCVSRGLRRVNPLPMAGLYPIEEIHDVNDVDIEPAPENNETIMPVVEVPEDLSWPTFWGKIKSLGLTEEEAHNLLGVKSFKEIIDGGQTKRDILKTLWRAVRQKEVLPPKEEISPLIEPEDISKLAGSWEPEK
ncbi:MAG: hypothetical protein DDT23_00043 [candidate division WS2 bacterium]|nr:hypothetical protein [Candidatus Lithacetigena glycinireducens]